jgi:hypothetical protein
MTVVLSCFGTDMTVVLSCFGTDMTVVLSCFGTDISIVSIIYKMYECKVKTAQKTKD